MSETVRVFNEFGTRRYKRRGGFYKFLFKIFVLAIIVFSFWFLWTTRDLYPVERFIPSSPAFEIFSPQLMQNYQNIIQFPLWNLVESSSSVYEIKKMLSDEQKIPLWIIKHLIYDFFYFSINDIHSFNNVLLIIRLSRIGCVIENFYSWTQPVEIDWAGGLNLKYIPEQKLYYSRKGRVLLLSTNRETLIQALTQEGNKRSQTILAKELLKNQGKHLAWGTLTPSHERFQELISSVHFYIGLTQNQLGLRCETQINPDPETPWSILLTEIVSASLREPADALFSISLDTGVPIKTWLRAFEVIPQASIALPSSTTSELPFEEWIKSFAPLVDNQFYIAIDTLYKDEIIPFIPRYCVIAKNRPNMCENIIRTIIEPTIIILGERNKALSVSNSNEYIVPLIGSSQTDLHIQCTDEFILFSNNSELQSRTVEYIKNKPLSSEGNYSLILQMKPEKIVEEINDATAVLTDSNILQFHDPKKINDLFNKIKLFKEIKIKISLDKGQLKISGVIEFNSK